MAPKIDGQRAPPMDSGSDSARHSRREPIMEQFINTTQATQHIPWNKGKLVGQKAPLKL
jgi:hypothetical protein